MLKKMKVLCRVNTDNDDDDDNNKQERHTCECQY